jgi:hypothetical protein
MFKNTFGWTCFSVAIGVFQASNRRVYYPRDKVNKQINSRFKHGQYAISI